MIPLRIRSAGVAALALTSTTALAASACAETVAITHAHIFSMGAAGEIVDGVVVIRNGRIASVGRGPAPSGAQVIDAAGGVVTPGLIAASSPISTVEIEGVEATNDDATKSDRLSAAFDIQYAVNPDSAAIPVARMGGVTDAIVTPTFGRDKERKDLIFAGQAAVIDLGAAGVSGADPIRRAHAAMVLALGEEGADHAGGSRAAEMVLLRAILSDVRRYAAAPAGYFREAPEAYNLRREDLAALVPVVRGQVPLLVSVHRATDIRQVLKLAREEKLKIILQGAEEGWRVAPEIAAAHVAVLVDAHADLPASFEALGATLENAARLNAAGVSVVIANPSLFEGGSMPRFAAGRAVAHGLPYGAALAALTINPAKAFGVSDRLGSLESGKDADLVIWSGDPLETSSTPVAVFVKGAAQPMRSRDLDLRDRYLAADVAAGKAAPTR